MAATREQLLEALDKADAAGDAEAAQHFAAQIKALSATPAATKPAIAQSKSFGQHASEFGENFARGLTGSVAGLGSNIVSAATKPSRMLMHATGVGKPVADYIERIPGAAKEMQESAKGVGGFLGGLTGDVAATAGLTGPVATGLKGAASLFPQASKAARVLTSAPVRAGVEGMIAGAALSPEDQVRGGIMGGVGGVAGQQLLSRTLGRLAKPIPIDKYADTEALMREGIPMTVGFGANPNTLSGRSLRFLEESAAGIPGFGAGVKAQREAARTAFRDVPINQVARTANVQMPVRSVGKTTADMLDQLHKNIGSKYDTLLTGKQLRPTGRLEASINNIVNDPKLSMTPGQRLQVRNLVEAHIYDRAKLPGQPPEAPLPRMLKAEDLFKSQSDIRQMGQKMLKSDLSSERAKGQALVGTADSIYEFIGRRFPRIGAELQALRKPYTTLSTVGKAAELAGVRGEFTPSQLGKVAMKRGDTELKHFASVAEPLLTKEPGAMGATARAALLLGGSTLMGGASIPIGAGLALGLGTRAGQRTLTGQLAAQKALAAALERNPELVNQITGIIGREAAIQGDQ